MVEKTQAEQRVLEAAREWLTERSPKTREEKTLFVAAARCWPEEMAGKEACGYGEQEACDECASASEIEAHPPLTGAALAMRAFEEIGNVARGAGDAS